MTVVRAELPELDDCPILTRLKAFVVDQGVVSTLEHTFRDKKGNVVDLSAWLATPESESLSESAAPAGTVKLRVREWIAAGPTLPAHGLWEAWGDGTDPANGVVQVELTAAMVETPGIFELNWAVINEDGRPTVLDRGIMSVERSLFPVNVSQLYESTSPPTLQEVRMMLFDSSGAENLLLEGVEFSDEQILLALTKPVRDWNETPPPIVRYTTSTFPFRGAWITGVLSELHLMAGNKYRRNRLAHSAGGVTVDDLNKEREYVAEGQRLAQKYDAWLANKKTEMNMRLFSGYTLSQYSRGGW